MTAHLLLHDLADDQRRGVELQRVGIGFAPAHVIGLGIRLPVAQGGQQFAAAPPAVFQPFRALCLRFQQGGQRLQITHQTDQPIGKPGPFLQLRQ